MALEAVAREMASWDERPEPPPRRVRRQTGASVVFSVRLEHDEVEMIEARAARMGLRPTHVARNLIRSGLSTERSDEIVDTVARLDQIVQELRSLTG